MKIRQDRDPLAARVRWLAVVFASAMAIIASTFWFVQVVRGDYYRELAENNRLREEPIQAPRGLILDHTGRILVENVPSYTLLVDRSRMDDREAALVFAARVLETEEQELSAILDRHRRVAAFRPILLAEGLTLSQVARFRVAGLEHPEFDVQVRHLRLYRHGSQAAHALGYLGEVSEVDLGTDDVYAPGDLVGRQGVEESYEALLRGSDGQSVVVVDSRGKALSEHARRAARSGEDLVLTLDLGLQQEAERLLEDRVGAIVALDPRNGEILALATSPSYNPNIFARRLDADAWNELVSAPSKPLLNRAVASAYSPGSPFKIVMIAAALAERVSEPEDTVYCSGAATFYNNQFRCWKRSGHGWVDMHHALKYSCDVYFYQLGQRLGIERIADYARRFGLGSKTGLDIRGERPGLVPSQAWSLKRRSAPWYPGETISVAIGQGPVLATPLQMAHLVAAVANSGYHYTPHLARKPKAAVEARQVDLPPRVWRVLQRGLWAVVNERKGTGRGALIPGLDVAGKTGTTQVIAQATWMSNQDLAPEHRDHAWFVSFAPRDAPSLVVVVFVEHGGKGSAAAAPIAKALYEHHFASLLGA